MFKEFHKTIFDKIGNPKDKQSYRFIHYWLNLKVYVQWFYRVDAKGLQNTPNKHRAVDIDFIVDEGQAGQGLNGSSNGDLQQQEGRIGEKTAKVHQDN